MTQIHQVNIYSFLYILGSRDFKKLFSPWTGFFSFSSPMFVMFVFLSREKEGEGRRRKEKEGGGGGWERKNLSCTNTRIYTTRALYTQTHTPTHTCLCTGYTRADTCTTHTHAPLYTGKPRHIRSTHPLICLHGCHKQGWVLADFFFQFLL